MPTNILSSVKKQKVLYLLLDYDNTATCLFPEVMEENPVTQSHLKTNADLPLLFMIRATRSVLDSFLDKKAADATIVELGVGSTRQTRQHDDEVNKRYRLAGSCFRLFADLARQKGWYFNKMLLGDLEWSDGTLRQIPLELGATMGSLGLDQQGKHRYLSDSVADSMQSSPDENKIRLLEHHIKYIKTKYPSTRYDVELVFVDDNVPKILNPLAAHIMGKIAPQTIDIELIHFNCYEQFNLLKKSLPMSEADILDGAEKRLYTYGSYKKSATTGDVGFFKKAASRPDDAANHSSNSDALMSLLSSHKPSLTLLAMSISALVITRYLLGGHSKLESTAIASAI